MICVNSFWKKRPSASMRMHEVRRARAPLDLRRFRQQVERIAGRGTIDDAVTVRVTVVEGIAGIADAVGSPRRPGLAFATNGQLSVTSLTPSLSSSGSSGSPRRSRSRASRGRRGPCRSRCRADRGGSMEPSVFMSIRGAFADTERVVDVVGDPVVVGVERRQLPQQLHLAVVVAGDDVAGTCRRSRRRASTPRATVPMSASTPNPEWPPARADVEQDVAVMSSPGRRRLRARRATRGRDPPCRRR